MHPILFWLFAILMLGFGAAVVVNRNPVASALSLVGSFLCLAALFVSLDAFFIGFGLGLFWVLSPFELPPLFDPPPPLEPPPPATLLSKLFGSLPLAPPPPVLRVPPVLVPPVPLVSLGGGGGSDGLSGLA